MFTFLVVLKQGRPFLRFRLEKEQTSVGRGTEVDFFLPDARISRLHFVIERRASEFYLLDRSANGTYLNGQKTTDALLQDQDVIRVGDCELRYERRAVQDPPTTAYLSAESGSVCYDAHRGRLLYVRPCLKVRHAAGHRNIPLTKDVFRIGSLRSSDLVLADLPENSCQLQPIADGFLLRIVASTPPVNVNGQVVESDTILNFGDVLDIGGRRIELFLEEGEEKISPLDVTVFENMVGRSQTMRRQFALIDRYARNDAPVVVLGDTGTGKELVARALHQRGARARGPFIAINCSAISPQLFESELFGHERGAFTGAIKSRMGAIEAAHKGTLFLDEIGDLPLELQPKLLRVLETSTVIRVGALEPRSVDIRVVAATHKDLPQMVEEGRFRIDLFYRLFVLTVELPPLRDRLEDLPILIHHFLRQLSPDDTPHTITPGALSKLASYHFPGNVRELRHTLTRAVASCQNAEVTELDLSFIKQPGTPPLARDHHRPGHVLKLEDLERQAIDNALKLFNNNRKDAAQALGIARSTLHMRLKKYGIDEDE